MANIIRRRPFGELLGLRNDLDRFFDNSLRMFDLNMEDGWGMKPAVDMVETKEELVISVEIPGIKKEDVKITMADNRVIIAGEIFEEKDVEEKNYYHRERVRGRFSRSFHIPVPVNSSKASAAYKDGVLTLKLPKAEEAKPKEISISGEE
jgi:HSP20 family protein